MEEFIKILMNSIAPVEYNEFAGKAIGKMILSSDDVNDIIDVIEMAESCLWGKLKVLDPKAQRVKYPQKSNEWFYYRTTLDKKSDEVDDLINRLNKMSRRLSEFRSLRKSLDEIEAAHK